MTAGASKELGCDTQYRCHPHPKNSARAADLDRQSNPGYVAHTNGARHACGQRAEMGDVSWVVGLSNLPLTDQGRAEDRKTAQIWSALKK